MKRANGTGSVTKLSGKRRRPWAVRISGRDKYGQVVQRILSAHEKQAEAQAALDEYNRRQAAGLAPAVDTLSMTVGQVFEAWSKREYRKLGPASITSHNAAWRRRVSRFAERKMRDMARDALSDMQVARLAQMAAEGVPWADTALMLCYTGFRVSEFLGLTRFSYHPEEGGYLQGGMKTEAGKNRIVPVHPKIRPYLLAWLAKGGDTIICDQAGRPVPADEYREHFAVLMEQIGVPEATPHWCRHTFATRLHTAQADPLTVKWLLGHSTKADITAHYTHSTIAALSEAVGRLA